MLCECDADKNYTNNNVVDSYFGRRCGSGRVVIRVETEVEVESGVKTWVENGVESKVESEG